MTRRRKIGIAAIVAGALVAVGLGTAGAIAASGALSPEEESQAVIADAADRLGVEPGELSDALRAALESRVDAAVRAGRLTVAQGDELKERIGSGELPLLFGGLGGPWHQGHFGHMGHLDAAASYLGLDESELRDRLEDGQTLAEVAKAEGKPVDGLVQALVQEARSALDKAVADGRLTEERASKLAEGLEERITDVVNGEHRAPGLGHRFHWHGPPGFGGHDFGRFGPHA